MTKRRAAQSLGRDFPEGRLLGLKEGQGQLGWTPMSHVEVGESKKRMREESRRLAAGPGIKGQGDIREACKDVSCTRISTVP